MHISDSIQGVLIQLVKWAESEGFELEYVDCSSCEGTGIHPGSLASTCSSCHGTKKMVKLS